MQFCRFEKLDYFMVRILGVLVYLVANLQLWAQAEVAERPKHIILMIGDGMGLSQVAALEYTSKESTVFDRFGNVGFVKTHSANSRVTDSAAGATAMACGVKTYNNAIGVTADTVRCKNIFEYAREEDFGTGIVVTSSITHATPAAFIAHEPLRALQEQIAADYVEFKPDCMIGGGMVYFTTRFSDQRHLIDEMEEGGYTVETFQQRSLRQLAGKQIDKLAYFTAFTEPLPVHAGRDYLPYATEFTMHFLQEKFQSGFILLVEGSQIDFAGHARDVNYMLYEMQDFVEAIEQALHFAENNGETLVLVTADHATGELTLREGNPNRRAKLKFLSNKHTSEMVPIFSYGPGSEHFRGIMDNTEIFFKLKELLQF